MLRRRRLSLPLSAAAGVCGAPAAQMALAHWLVPLFSAARSARCRRGARLHQQFIQWFFHKARPSCSSNCFSFCRARRLRWRTVAACSPSAGHNLCPGHALPVLQPQDGAVGFFQRLHCRQQAAHGLAAFQLFLRQRASIRQGGKYCIFCQVRPAASAACSGPYGAP